MFYFCHDRLLGSSTIEKYDDHSESDFLLKRTNPVDDMQPFFSSDWKTNQSKTRESQWLWTAEITIQANNTKFQNFKM